MIRPPMVHLINTQLNAVVYVSSATDPPFDVALVAHVSLN